RPLRAGSSPSTGRSFRTCPLGSRHCAARASGRESSASGHVTAWPRQGVQRTPLAGSRRCLPVTIATIANGRLPYSTTLSIGLRKRRGFGCRFRRVDRPPNVHLFGVVEMCATVESVRGGAGGRKVGDDFFQGRESRPVAVAQAGLV